MKKMQLNLNSDEEILYTGQKDNYNFGWCVFFCISVIVAVPILIYLGRNELYNYVLLFLLTLMFLCGWYFLYIYIRDYLTCNIFLTSQRLLILSKNVPTSIEYSDISYMMPVGSGSGLFPDFLFFKLKSNKKYRIKFIKGVEFKQKFQEIYPDYDDSEIQERGCKVALIVIPIMFVLYILLRLFLK